MDILIDGKPYFLEISVRETYFKDGVMEIETLSLEKWADVVSKKAIFSLYEIEEIMSKELGREIKLNIDYKNIRKPILNFSGTVDRLPNNLIVEVKSK